MQNLGVSLSLLLMTLLALSATACANHLCSCLHLETHPQTRICQGDFIIQVNIKAVTTENNYIVKFQKSFLDKTNHFNESQEDDLIIENFNKCQADLKLNQTYVISGKIISGKPTVSKCQLSILLNKLPEKLVKSYEEHMNNYCACKIVEKKLEEKTTVDQKNECILDSQSGLGNKFCQKLNSFCLKNTESGTCEWQNSLYYNDCVEIKRNRRYTNFYPYSYSSYPGYPFYQSYSMTPYFLYDFDTIDYDDYCDDCYYDHYYYDDDDYHHHHHHHHHHDDNGKTETKSD